MATTKLVKTVLWDDYLFSINTDGTIGVNENSPETLVELTHTAPYITLHNSTEEDGDGGRESRIIFKGEQSGGEETTLAKIQASHDGASDDEKGDLIIYVNDGNDGNSPSEVIRFNSDGDTIHANNIIIDDTTFINQSGIIYKDTTPFFHNFNYGDNGTVTTNGGNLFIGGAGNLTMGGTATAVTEASGNTAIGVNAFDANTLGKDSFALGAAALGDNTTGNTNLAIGKNAGGNNIDGGTNIFIGNSAGHLEAASADNTSSDQCIDIGVLTKTSTNNAQNEIVIGYSAIGQGDNTIMLGNSSVTGLFCYDTSIASPSDIRVKKDIISLDPAIMLDFITDLRPVTYKKKNPLDWDEDIKLTNFKDITIKNEKDEDELIIADERPDDNPNQYAGFIAQEVESAMIAHEIDYQLVPTTPSGMKTIRYTDIIPALTGAIIAQQDEITQLKIDCVDLLKRIEILEPK